MASLRQKVEAELEQMINKEARRFVRVQATNGRPPKSTMKRL
jgi:hypothetical protein